MVKLVFFSCLIAQLIQSTYSNIFQAEGLQMLLLERCGLPTNYWSTKHCFADPAHHTCCQLGPQAREYAERFAADGRGLQVGTAALHAYHHLHGSTETASLKVNTTVLTPWCTSMYSMDCSAWAERFPRDGTKVIFINDPEVPGRIITDVKSEVACEAKTREWIKKVPASFVLPNTSDPVFNVDPKEVSQHIYSLRGECKDYFPELHIETINPPPSPPQAPFILIPLTNETDPTSLQVETPLENLQKTLPTFDCTSDQPMPGWAMAECAYSRKGVNGSVITIDQYIDRKGINATERNLEVRSRKASLPIAQGGGAQIRFTPPAPKVEAKGELVSSGGLSPFGRKFSKPVVMPPLNSNLG